MLLLEQNTNKKWQVDKKTSQLKFKDDDNSKEYGMEAICDSVVYARESEGHL